MRALRGHGRRSAAGVAARSAQCALPAHAGPALAELRHCLVPSRARQDAIRSFASGAAAPNSDASSESTLGLLHLIEGRGSRKSGFEEGPAEGRVLSSAGGLSRVEMSGPVAVGQLVSLGGTSQGVVLQYNRHGVVVAELTQDRPRAGAIAELGGALSVQAPVDCKGVTFTSVAEMLQVEDGTGTGGVLRLPRMPIPQRRRPVLHRLASGLAAAEILLPLGEGQRVGFVGPHRTGKSTAARMLLSSQSQDTVCVYATMQPRAKLEAQLNSLEGGCHGLVVVHADPMDPAGLRYLQPLCALHIAAQLRKAHRHVVLVLDDLVAFSEVAAELSSSAGRGSALPLSASHIVSAALDSAGCVEEGGRQSALSVITVLDLEPDDELPSAQRDLWRGAEPSLDVSLRFDGHLAANGVLPAINLEELWPCGFAPSFQAPLLRLLRRELVAVLQEGSALKKRLDAIGELGLHVEMDEQEAVASAAAARSLFSHSAPRSLPELTVLLCAAVVYSFPPRRHPSPTAVAEFQRRVLDAIQTAHPVLWQSLSSLEALSEEQAAGALQNLGRALLQHR